MVKDYGRDLRELLCGRLPSSGSTRVLHGAYIRGERPQFDSEVAHCRAAVAASVSMARYTHHWYRGVGVSVSLLLLGLIGQVKDLPVTHRVHSLDTPTDDAAAGIFNAVETSPSAGVQLQKESASYAQLRHLQSSLEQAGA